MFRRMICIASLALLAISCSSETTPESDETAIPVSIVDFNASPADFVDKKVVVSGTVDHVCKHGGKRLFIMGDTPEDRLKIETGEKISAFDVLLEGSTIRVEGIGCVLKMDEAYLDNWEAEVLANEEEHAEEEHGEGEVHDEGEAHTEEEHGEGEGGDDHHHGDPLEQINELRQRLADSGEEYIGFYHIECLIFEELD